MKSNAPLNLPASVIQQIALAIVTAVASGKDPKAAEQAILAKLAPPTR